LAFKPAFLALTLWITLVKLDAELEDLLAAPAEIAIHVF